MYEAIVEMLDIAGKYLRNKNYGVASAMYLDVVELIISHELNLTESEYHELHKDFGDVVLKYFEKKGK